MNTRSFERRLQQVSSPAPDPEARLRARHAAVTEFERLHTRPQRTPPARQWFWQGPWISGLATACVAVIGVSIIWLMPEREREIQMPAALNMTKEADIIADSATVSQSAPAQPQTRTQVNTAGAQDAAVTLALPEAAPAPAAEDISMGNTIDGGHGVSESSQSDKAMEQATVTATRSVSVPPPVIVQHLPPPPSTALRQASTASPALIRVIPTPPTSRDRFERFETNPVKRTADEPVSTFSVDVDTTSYSFTRRMLRNGVLPPQDAVRTEEMINYFDYGWPAPDSRRQPFRPTVTVSDSPWGEGRKLVHIGIKGYEHTARTRPDANLVLLLDVSGSMNAPDRLPLVRQSMKLLLDTLKPTDTVAIVVYAGAAGEVLPPTPVRQREAIENALDSLRPGGSTAGARGIQLAYQLAERNFRADGINRIVLATDGDFNVGVSDPGELQRLMERERGKGIYLSVLGFGQGNYRDDIAQQLAQNGNGVAAYIDTLAEARKVLVQEASSALFPIADDVKIQVEFNPATVAEYRLVGYETRALNREDFNNDKVDAGEVGSGSSVTAIYEITPVGSGAQLIDERRYAAPPAPAAGASARSNEYGFLRIRYKLPGGDESRLMEQPIRVDTGVPRALRNDVAFSTAVAGFAQLLRGGSYTSSLDYDAVLRQAEGALGNDPYGYRMEFLELVRRARVIGGTGDQESRTGGNAGEAAPRTPSLF